MDTFDSKLLGRYSLISLHTIVSGFNSLCIGCDNEFITFLAQLKMKGVSVQGKE